MQLSEMARSAAATYFQLGPGSSVTFHTPTRIQPHWRAALEELHGHGLISKEPDPRGGLTYKSNGTDVMRIGLEYVRENPPWESDGWPGNPIMFEEPKIWILWGVQDACVEFARQNGVEARYWKKVNRADQLQGYEGPKRDPDSPHLLFVLPGYGWDGMTQEERAFAEERGFELTQR